MSKSQGALHLFKYPIVFFIANRVFAERLIIEKPHPWGLIYTFIELIRNLKYNFKKKSNDQIFEAIFSKVFKTIVTNSQDLAN